MYNSKLDMLDSCTNKSNIELFSKILAVLFVCFVQSITVQIKSLLQLAIY